MRAKAKTRKNEGDVEISASAKRKVANDCVRLHFRSVIRGRATHSSCNFFCELVYDFGMRSVFHTILIWLMLLAVPVQGFAAASMLLCEPIVVSHSGSSLPHHHDQTQISQGSEHAHDHQHTGNHHTADKCGACAACCIAVAMTAPASAVLPQMHIDSERIAALDAFPSSVVPDYPDRPPQASFV
jgi:hypothetical protein